MADDRRVADLIGLIVDHSGAVEAAGGRVELTASVQAADSVGAPAAGVQLVMRVTESVGLPVTRASRVEVRTDDALDLEPGGQAEPEGQAEPDHALPAAAEG